MWVFEIFSLADYLVIKTINYLWNNCLATCIVSGGIVLLWKYIKKLHSRIQELSKLTKHDAQWYGTYDPPFWFRVLLNFGFWWLIMTHKLFITNKSGNSSELLALNRVLLFFKGVHSADLKIIRTPFLGIITPEPLIFSFDIFRVNNMDVFSINANKKEETTLLLYIHGGGFVSGDFGGFRCFVHEISERAGLPLLFPNYRLIPEHDLSDQVDDVINMIKYASEQNKRVVIIGDSAGGCLILLALQKIVANNGKMPDRAILISPVTDLGCNNESHYTNRDKCMFDSDVVKQCMNIVCKGEDSKKLSPIYQDLFGICPLYIMVSTSELFIDDTKHLVDKARQQNVMTTVVFKDNVPHSYPLFYFATPECNEGLEQIVKWIK